MRMLMKMAKYSVKMGLGYFAVGTLDGAKCINPIVKLLFKHVPMSIRSSLDQAKSQSIFQGSNLTSDPKVVHTLNSTSRFKHTQ